MNSRRVGIVWGHDSTGPPSGSRKIAAAVSPQTYRRWFLAAVCYNLTWGAAVMAYPRWFLYFAGMDAAAAPLAQCIGMMVGVYGYGYYLVAREPDRYRGYVWIALAGKAFGVVGYVMSASAGTLPWRFGAITLMNDLIWLPAFGSFLLRRNGSAAVAMR